MFFFFKQKTAYEMLRSLVGSEMCIRDRFTNALANEEYSVAWDVLLCSSSRGKEVGRKPAMEPFIADPAVTLSRLQLVVGRDPARARQEIGRYYLQVVERMRAVSYTHLTLPTKRIV
eukprot:TRINITY_DN35021_c0_g1_i1.p1 TRINITY_DN35021_c0_g1~~TRINITY_DN35021_c0_g1_i1.p1  ORF type:complete len:117 (+),score=36.95 TRINITY_DN35021_c0_g1_i1:64-414(+)